MQQTDKPAGARHALIAVAGVALCLAGDAWAGESFQESLVPTSGGDLKVTFIGEASLMFRFKDVVIHVDPWSELTDYGKLPKADIILVTHEHADHLDLPAIRLLQTTNTVNLVAACSWIALPRTTMLTNGAALNYLGLKIEAVPAYNTVHLRPDGEPRHPKGNGNGYVLTFGDKRVYVAGDTENTPEMEQLPKIDVAFLPVSPPSTMTVDMAEAAVKAIRPRILYPYHADPKLARQLADRLKSMPGIDVRMLRME
jgi:L-ascorbate metabolism protein UlaG (beta-lactamase superfamily)